MPRRAAVLLVCLIAVLVPASSALAGHGGKTAPAASCTVAGNLVQAAGLPTDQVVNFMVTDASGTTGWVLGFTPDGSWSVYVPARTGATTYQFVSKTFGPGGSKYTVFASCSA